MIEGVGRVLADLQTGTPARGFRWGPKDGSWKLAAHYQGFSVRADTTVTTHYGGDCVWATQDPVLNDTVYYYNDSGEEIPAFAVMCPEDAPVELDGAWCCLVKKQTTVFRRRYLINGPFAIPSGGFGRASNGEHPTVVLCETTTVTYPDGWGVQEGSWKLEKCCPGNFTALRSSGTGRGLFMQADCDHLIVKLTEPLDQGDHATAKICKGGPPVDGTPTDIVVEVYEKEMTVGTTFGADVFLGVTWRAGAWYLDWYSECPG